MNFYSKLVTGGLTLAMALAITFGVGAGRAAAACYNYDPNGGNNTSQTPVFNNYCNAPYGIGNEADFVRIRENSNGNVRDNQGNPAYTNAITNACTSGAKFDVWNYIHNDASEEFNNNGSGSAVAKNVQLALSAPVGTTKSTFSFGGTISASNAASVSDTATLTCADGKQVKLSLVPNTVSVYSSSYGWKELGDGAVNGTTRVGSPVFGSGDVYGCWQYRIVVVYQVTVTDIPPQPKPVTAVCELFTLKAVDTRKFAVDQFKYTAQNTNVTKVVVNWGDGKTDEVTNPDDVKKLTHTYADSDETKTYTAYATVHFANGTTSGGPNTVCAQKVTLSKDQQPPVITTVVQPTPSQPVTRLVATGPEAALGLFSAVTVAGALAHRWMLGRRYNG